MHRPSSSFPKDSIRRQRGGWLTRIGFGSLSLLWAASGPAATVWTENSFQDFRDGHFLDAGSNLYVSARGRVQIINRWDLNNDGHLDLVLPAGHGHTEHERTFVYLNKRGDFDGRQRIELPGNYARDGLVADFDQDGRNDLVIANYADNHFHDLDTWVFYGTDEGYRTDRRTRLPAWRNRGVAAGDFNGDGWLDLAAACEWQAGGEWQEGGEPIPHGPRMSFIYWNSPEGFGPDRMSPLSFDGEGAMDVAAGDLDGDGKDDLIMAANGNCHVLLSSRDAFANPERRTVLPFAGKSVSLGDANGDGQFDLAICMPDHVVLLYGQNGLFEPSEAIRLEVSRPSEAVFADVDGDGRDDIIVANFATPGGATWTDSHVFYADGAALTDRDPLRLPTLGASGVSAGDLNGDGRPEIVISNGRVTNEMTLLSYVFWNMDGAYQFGHHSQLRTEGSVANALGDVNNDGWDDIVFLQYEGGFRDGPRKSHVYWGDGKRNFSITRRTEFHTHHVFGYGHADLDDDGAVDLLLCEDRFITGVQHEQSGIAIQWGGESGFEAPTNLSLGSAYGGVRIADLNRDGYLDIVSGGSSIDPSTPGIHGIPIFWGSSEGYRHDRRSIIPVEKEKIRGPLLMDLNKDGWLDISGQVALGTFTTWWGDADGYSAERETTIRFAEDEQLMYIKGADLNRDGWLDLLLPHRGRTNGPEVESYVFYGSPDGFSVTNQATVRAWTPYDNSIADFDRDGWLDLFLTSYSPLIAGNPPSLIYWGDPEGFTTRARFELETHGSSGSEALDYDGDGWIDVFAANHRKGTSPDEPSAHRHVIPSMLFWGSADGYSSDQRWEVEAVGVSGLNLRDPGNSYDRGLYEDYVSSVFGVPAAERPVKMTWQAETPHGTSVALQIRISDTPEDLEKSAWIGPTGPDSWFTETPSTVPEGSGRWLQYRARLATPNAGPTPYLTEVSIVFE